MSRQRSRSRGVDDEMEPTMADEELLPEATPLSEQQQLLSFLKLEFAQVHSRLGTLDVVRDDVAKLKELQVTASTRIDEISAEQRRLSDMQGAHAAELADLKKRLRDVELISTTSAAASATSAAVGGAQPGAATWAPSAIFVKGWVLDWNLRFDQGLLKDDGLALLARLLDVPGVSAHVDAEATYRTNTHEILMQLALRLKPHTSKDDAWAVRQLVQTALDTQPDLSARGARLRAQLEQSPQRAPFSRAIGRAHGTIGRILRAGARLTPQVSSGQLDVLVSAAGLPRPVSVATWTPAKGWEIHVEHMRATSSSPEVDVEALYAALRF